MRGITPRREQGMTDPVLAEMVYATGATESRHYAAVKPTIQAYRASWVTIAPRRDGVVNPQRTVVNDPAAMTARIKAKATELGADMVGVCRLQPDMIDLGSEVPHEFVIAACVAEDYEKVMQGPDAVEEEAMWTYARCAEIATERTIARPSRPVALIRGRAAAMIPQPGTTNRSGQTTATASAGRIHAPSRATAISSVARAAATGLRVVAAPRSVIGLG